MIDTEVDWKMQNDRRRIEGGQLGLWLVLETFEGMLRHFCSVLNVLKKEREAREEGCSTTNKQRRR